MLGINKNQLYFGIFIIVLFILIGLFIGFKTAGGIAALFGLGAAGVKKKVNQVKKDAEKEEKTVNEVEQNMKSRKQRRKARKQKDKKLSDKMKNFFGIFLIFLLVMGIYNMPVIAEDNNSKVKGPEISIDNLKVPDDYDTLVEYYKNMAMIAIQYQQLYRAAEKDNERADADNQALIESNSRLQNLVETQQEIINNLLQSQGMNIGVMTGVNYVPLNPQNTGVIVGVNLQF